MNRPYASFVLHGMLWIAVWIAAWGAVSFASGQPFGADAPMPGSNPRSVDADASPFRIDQLPDFGRLGPGQGVRDRWAGAPQRELSLTATFSPTNRDQAVLRVTARMGEGWHLYSLTQPGDVVPATRVQLASSAEYQLLSPFEADRPPKVRRVEYFDDPLEEHYGEVVFSAPIRLAPGVDLAALEIHGTLTGQVCHDERGCVPLDTIDASFVARMASPPPSSPFDASAALDDDPGPFALTPPARERTIAGASGEFRIPQSYAAVRGRVEPAVVAPGGKAKLLITIAPDRGWHVYPYAPTDPEDVSKPTLIVLTESSGIAASPPRTDAPIIEGPPLFEGAPRQQYHEGAATWTIDLQVPADLPPGDYVLAGMVGYQVCTDVSCDRPLGVEFRGEITVAAEPAGARESRPLNFQEARYRAAAEAAAKTAANRAEAGAAEALDLKRLREHVEETSSYRDASLLYVLPIAILGGLILNIMPCVLPVIGLKVMSFVSQAGESRARVFALNVWYALGMLSVFWSLAAVMIFWNFAYQETFGWGAQFNFPVYTIALAAIVFAMGLSFLGVWEIPIPGFAAGSTAAKMAEKEGPAGAFAKGIVTTLLATPCSGPGLAVAIAWAAGRSPAVVLTVFTALGLGMASPYLILGAFPALVRFLPKPGAWMETFKQLMGFVLLGTVIFLFSFLEPTLVVPTLALLVAIWAGCWWVGRLAYAASRGQKLRAWAVAAAIMLLAGLWAFSPGFSVGGWPLPGLYGIMAERSERRIERAVAQRLDALGGGEAFAAAAGNGSAAASAENAYVLPWEPFSLARLQQLTSEGKTVLVDFTADWCLTCKTLEKFVLNTRDVREVVDRNGVVTLVADWTDRDPEMGRLLETLSRAKQVPVLAIFPADRPNQPIVLAQGWYTKSEVITRLEEAGPSRSAAAARTAMAP